MEIHNKGIIFASLQQNKDTSQSERRLIFFCFGVSVERAFCNVFYFFREFFFRRCFSFRPNLPEEASQPRVIRRYAPTRKVLKLYVAKDAILCLLGGGGKFDRK